MYDIEKENRAQRAHEKYYQIHRYAVLKKHNLDRTTDSAAAWDAIVEFLDSCGYRWNMQYSRLATVLMELEAQIKAEQESMEFGD